MEIAQEFEQIEQRHKILIDKAIAIMKDVEDVKHSISHVFSVVNYTKEILKYVKEANKEVCIISAYWHDVGRKIQAKGHAKISANMLQQEMRNLKYEEELIEKCYQAIENHSWKERPKTLEGNILRDADKIDFVGIGRWKECVEKNCSFNKILALLPNIRKDILKLECSKEVFDREIADLVIYLHDIIFQKNQ